MVIVKQEKGYTSEKGGRWFTFQYGYSKTVEVPKNKRKLSRFTFQYGYSKTENRVIKKEPFKYLHSNMVIVKLKQL